MPRIRALCVLLVLVLSTEFAAASAQREGAAPLEFALAPYISTRPLLTMFQPLATHLGKRLGREVLLVTAPSLREFDLRALKGTYELAMMSPQSAVLAQKDAGYVPLLRVSDDLFGVVIVPKDSAFRGVRDLAGHRIALPDRFTATAQLGKELLDAEDLGGDNIVHPVGFQDSILLSMLRGEIEAMVMNGSAFHQMTPETRARVRVLAETRRISHVMFLVRGDTSADAQRAIRSGIVEFFEATAEGRQFAIQTGLTGVRAPTDAELKALEPYAQEHRRLLGETAGSKP
jgi:phosphonate transport system substrate-binding protein